jgi:hypothetical protein
LAQDRWYATATLTQQLNNLQGREEVLVLGGTKDRTNYTRAANPTWDQYEALIVNSGPTAAPLSSGLLNRVDTTVPGNLDAGQTWPGPGDLGALHSEDDELFEYPRAHVLTNGKVFVSGYCAKGALLDPEHPSLPLSIWDLTTGDSNWSFPRRHDGASLLLPNASGRVNHIMRLGGCDASEFEFSAYGSTQTIEHIQADQQGPWLTDLTKMPEARYLLNAVILPDASILVIGGQSRLPDCGPVTGPPVDVLTPSLFKDGTWTQMAPHTSRRNYHSTAVLLPDGRVFVGGGNDRTFDYEIYSPPYLTTGLVRPVLASLTPLGSTTPTLPCNFPGTLRLVHGGKYTCTYSLPAGTSVKTVVLMAPGSTTHHSDMHQQYYEMATVVSGGSSVNFTAPPSDKHVRRGLYMLFLISTLGAPSIATWVAFQ